MNDGNIPPLPDLEIDRSSKVCTDQQTVDTALRIVYNHRPDLFARFAEREKEDLGVEEYAPAFYNLVSTEVWKHIAKPDRIARTAGSILFEARRRARLMYDIPPYPELHLEPVKYIPGSIGITKPHKYAVFAGKGSLPKLVIAELPGAKVICFEGERNPEITPDVVTRFGKVGFILDYLKENNIQKIIFAGAMQRPDLKTLSPDAEGAKLLAKILAGSFFSKGFGDDKLLSLLTKFLEDKGFEVVGAHDVLREILAPKGLLGSVTPADNAENDIKIGIEALQKIGSLDIGQAVVVEDGIVLAIEAAEGTANMVARAGGLRKSYGGVLVKFKKPEQLDKADLPSIGPDTIAQVAAAGIKGIAVEAGETLLLEKAKIIEAADKAGVFVVGV